MDPVLVGGPVGRQLLAGVASGLPIIVPPDEPAVLLREGGVLGGDLLCHLVKI
jgi:hypothetical protein